jgi:hypothetical protein
MSTSNRFPAEMSGLGRYPPWLKHYGNVTENTVNLNIPCGLMEAGVWQGWGHIYFLLFGKSSEMDSLRGMGVWQGVAMDLPKFHLDPPCPLPNPFTPCGQATPETAFQPFQGWPACRASGLWPSSTPLDTPRCMPLLRGYWITSYLYKRLTFFVLCLFRPESVPRCLTPWGAPS